MKVENYENLTLVEVLMLDGIAPITITKPMDGTHVLVWIGDTNHPLVWELSYTLGWQNDQMQEKVKEYLKLKNTIPACDNMQ